MADWADATTLSQAWVRAVADRGDHTFLVFERPDGAVNSSRVTGEGGTPPVLRAVKRSGAAQRQEKQTWTYAEFDAEVCRVAKFLVKHGVVPGSSVHVALTNSPTFVAVWLAALGLRAWIVPSDPMGTATELRGHINRTSPVIGFCSNVRAGVYRSAAAGSTVATIVEIDESDCTLDVFGHELLSDWPSAELLDRAAVMFTSGTTGAPKGVEITQANYAFAGASMAAAASLAPNDRQLVVLPLFHANAQYYSFASAIWVGASVALMPTFSASGFLTQVARHRATHASLFAAPIRMILASGATPVEGVALTHCWYAMNISDDQHELLSSLLGCRPRQLYGMTETIPAVLTDSAEGPVPSSMGFVTSGCEVEIHDADGDRVPLDTVGEIVVRGNPGVTLFAGYLDDPATTNASFRNGWFLTGDRARCDVDGRFFFDGRRSDVLKVAGENVSTVEVEQVLSSHPGVLEAAVVGQPDEVRDEVPVGFVVLADVAHPPSVDDLYAWCAERLTKAKRPRDITFVDALPRTSVGKIRKFLLRDPNAETTPTSTSVQPIPTESNAAESAVPQEVPQ